MSVLAQLLSVGLLGAGGGLVNALLTEKGFVLSGTHRLPDGQRIWRPGFLGNAVIGCVAAVVFAGLYTPLAVSAVSDLTSPYNLTVQAIMSAVVSGIGGARLLKREVDSHLDTASIASLGQTVQTLVATVQRLQNSLPGEGA